MTVKMLIGKRKQAQRLGARSKALLECDLPTLEKRLSPSLADGETMPDVALLMTLVVRDVDARLEDLDTAVRDDDRACGLLRLARRDRQDAWSRVRAVLSRFRDLFLGLFARSPVKPQLCAAVPGRPYELLRHADYVLGKLRDPACDLPETPLISVDPPLLATNLEPGAADLRAALGDVEAGEAEVCRTKEEKRRAKAAFEAGYGPAHRLLEAVAALAGTRVRLLESGFGG